MSISIEESKLPPLMQVPLSVAELVSTTIHSSSFSLSDRRHSETARRFLWSRPWESVVRGKLMVDDVPLGPSLSTELPSKLSSFLDDVFLVVLVKENLPQKVDLLMTSWGT